jgi:transitional endoplasmic reticulum ATPase
MPEPQRAWRPTVETFDRPGVTISVLDPRHIFAIAATGPVEVLHAPSWPAPVRRVRMTVGPGPDGFELAAEVHSGSGTAAGRSGFSVLGNDPLGSLLSRRVDAGDPRAVRLVEGLQTAVGAVTRRLGVPAPATGTPTWERGEVLGSETVADAATGLSTTVTRYALAGASRPGDGRVVTLRAGVPVEAATAAHLAAFVDALLRVSDGLAARDPGAVRRVTLSAYRFGDPAGEDPGRVDLDQVGGLDQVVAQFREIAGSFRHPTAMARWGARRPQGILLYGPAGTGKTMLARALATEIGGSMREIRTPEILDKWLGASERNIKRIFREARRYRVPTVMLFDEFDSIISYAGAGNDSGSQAINAVAGIFKQEMNDLIEHNPNVIVVATTNFPDVIDESLTRSGRFDIKIEIPLPDRAAREQIITLMIRRLAAAYEVDGFRMFADDLDVPALARASQGRTGADLREVFRRAQMAKAMQEARTGEAPAPIDQADLLTRIRELG